MKDNKDNIANEETEQTVDEKIIELENALEALKAEAEKAKAEAAEANDKYFRIAAEYDNYRKRATKEKDAAYGEAYASAVASFLPLIDNMERACEYAAAEQSQLSEGVLMLSRQLGDIMAKIGVTEIESDGKPFDPQLHNAVLHEEDDSEAESVVSQTLQKGYMLKDRVIRHAMVKVLN